MSRLVVVILLLLLLGGGAYYLSTQAETVPTRTIEVDVQQAGNAG